MLPDIRVVMGAILATIGLMMVAFALVATMRVAQTGARSPLELARQQTLPVPRDPQSNSAHGAPIPDPAASDPAATIVTAATSHGPVVASPSHASDRSEPISPEPHGVSTDRPEADRRALDAIVAAIMNAPEPPTLAAPAVQTAIAPAAPEAIAAARPPMLAAATLPAFAIVLPLVPDAAPPIGGPAPEEAAADRAKALTAIANRRARAEAARKVQAEAAARKARLARARQARINAAKRTAEQRPDTASTSATFDPFAR